MIPSRRTGRLPSGQELRDASAACRQRLAAPTSDTSSRSAPSGPA